VEQLGLCSSKDALSVAASTYLNEPKRRMSSCTVPSKQSPIDEGEIVHHAVFDGEVVGYAGFTRG
jgi:hypothetical protein